MSVVHSCRAALALLATLAALPGQAADTPARPRPNSLEYRLSWGAAALRPDAAWRQGATGQGVLVAMIDTGLAAPRGLFAHVSPDSVDLVPRAAAEQGDARHGEQTASLIAGTLDGAGTVGVAYRATLLSIRADRDGSCRTQCSFDPVMLARGLDYAVARGARVIGLPLSTRTRIPQIEPALERAVASGALIVAAAGNEGAAEPVWPARYAGDPRFAGAMIVAGASTPSGRFARWSNRAGVAPDRFLVAPGERVVVDCGQRYCSLVSGTSYSAAYVAGAAAALMSRYPGLPGPAVATLLLEGGRELGGRGVDRDSGRGLLDLSRALRRAEAMGAGAGA